MEDFSNSGARPGMRIAATVLALLFLLAPLAGAKVHENKVFVEVAEVGVSGLGQHNCAAEALAHVETPGCPVTTDARYHPNRAIRMLDNVYTLMPGVEGYFATVRDAANPDSGTPSNFQGTNPRRQTNGELPDVIYPGLAQFEGWYGRWFDDDGDGIMQFRRGKTSLASAYPPDNEWFPLLSGAMMSFIEPGSHPSYGAWRRPTSDEPDIVYTPTMVSTFGAWGHADGVRSDGLVLFLDGTLMATVRVDTVVDPVLTPDPQGRFPFTLTDKSLLDIDLYSAVAPGPVAGIYGSTVGPAVTALGSPSMGLCPSQCRMGPVPLGGTPAGEALGPTVASIYSLYPREWMTGEMGVGAGRKEALVEDFQPWADLRPYWTPLTVVSENSTSARPGPVPGRGEHGGMGVLPGILSFELRTGLWHDKDADGIVGKGFDGDGYEGGTRPDPDDYLNAAGEFIGHNAVRTSTSTAEVYGIPVRLRPATTWGLVGVFVGAPPGVFAPEHSESIPKIVCAASNCVRDPQSYWYRGDETIVVSAYRDTQERGRYVVAGIMMPLGTRDSGFEACADVSYLRFASQGLDVVEPVWDCDTFEKLAEADAGAAG